MTNSTTPSNEARSIASEVTETHIAGQGPLHNALRQAEIDRNARFLDDVASTLGLNLADLAQTLEAGRAKKALAA
jgi:hypothetical protein